jgi:hypothetical protein
MAGLPEGEAAEDDHFLRPGRHLFYQGGREAYLKDLPKAEMHRLQSGHFALEDSLDKIAGKMKAFCA